MVFFIRILLNGLIQKIFFYYKSKNALKTDLVCLEKKLTDAFGNRSN